MLLMLCKSNRKKSFYSIRYVTDDILTEISKQTTDQKKNRSEKKIIEKEQTMN